MSLHELHMECMVRVARQKTVVVVLAILAGASAGCTTSSTGGGVPTSTSSDVTAPVSRPTQTALKEEGGSKVCTVISRPASSANAPRNPVALPPDPVAVDAIRIPGLNSHSCESGVVTASTSQAARLVTDINAIPALPGGTTAYSCPVDDGHGVDLAFRYRQSSEVLVVQVPFAGCPFVGGLRGSKWRSAALTTDLRTFVPPAWFRMVS